MIRFRRQGSSNYLFSGGASEHVRLRANGGFRLGWILLKTPVLGAAKKIMYREFDFALVPNVWTQSKL